MTPALVAPRSEGRPRHKRRGCRVSSLPCTTPLFVFHHALPFPSDIQDDATVFHQPLIEGAFPLLLLGLIWRNGYRYLTRKRRGNQPSVLTFICFHHAFQSILSPLLLVASPAVWLYCLCAMSIARLPEGRQYGWTQQAADVLVYMRPEIHARPAPRRGGELPVTW